MVMMSNTERQTLAGRSSVINKRKSDSQKEKIQYIIILAEKSKGDYSIENIYVNGVYFHI